MKSEELRKIFQETEQELFSPEEIKKNNSKSSKRRH